MWKILEETKFEGKVIYARTYNVNFKNVIKDMFLKKKKRKTLNQFRSVSMNWLELSALG